MAKKHSISYVRETHVEVKWLKDGQKQILSSDEWEVKSAGIEAHGVNPNAIKAMKEIGIDISNQTSDIIDLETLK